jgi:hypothetical protein
MGIEVFNQQQSTNFYNVSTDVSSQGVSDLTHPTQAATTPVSSVPVVMYGTSSRAYGQVSEKGEVQFTPEQISIVNAVKPNFDYTKTGSYTTEQGSAAVSSAVSEYSMSRVLPVSVSQAELQYGSSFSVDRPNSFLVQSKDFIGGSGNVGYATLYDPFGKQLGYVKGYVGVQQLGTGYLFSTGVMDKTLVNGVESMQFSEKFYNEKLTDLAKANAIISVNTEASKLGAVIAPSTYGYIQNLKPEQMSTASKGIEILSSETGDKTYIYPTTDTTFKATAYAELTAQNYVPDKYLEQAKSFKETNPLASSVMAFVAAPEYAIVGGAGVGLGLLSQDVVSERATIDTAQFMKNFESKTTQGTTAYEMATGGEALGIYASDYPSTGIATLQNIGSLATFGLIPQNTYETKTAFATIGTNVALGAVTAEVVGASGIVAGRLSPTSVTAAENIARLHPFASQAIGLGVGVGIVTIPMTYSMAKMSAEGATPYEMISETTGGFIGLTAFVGGASIAGKSGLVAGYREGYSAKQAAQFERSKESSSFESMTGEARVDFLTKSGITEAGVPYSAKDLFSVEIGQLKGYIVEKGTYADIYGREVSVTRIGKTDTTNVVNPKTDVMKVTELYGEKILDLGIKEQDIKLSYGTQFSKLRVAETARLSGNDNALYSRTFEMSTPKGGEEFRVMQLSDVAPVEFNARISGVKVDNYANYLNPSRFVSKFDLSGARSASRELSLSGSNVIMTESFAPRLGTGIKSKVFYKGEPDSQGMMSFNKIFSKDGGMTRSIVGKSPSTPKFEAKVFTDVDVSPLIPKSGSPMKNFKSFEQPKIETEMPKIDMGQSKPSKDGTSMVTKTRTLEETKLIESAKMKESTLQMPAYDVALYDKPMSSMSMMKSVSLTSPSPMVSSNPMQVFDTRTNTITRTPSMTASLTTSLTSLGAKTATLTNSVTNTATWTGVRTATLQSQVNVLKLEPVLKTATLTPVISPFGVNPKPFIPTPWIPTGFGLPNQSGGAGNKASGGSSFGGKRGKYAPSLTAVFLGIKAGKGSKTRDSDVFTGLELRPMRSSESKKWKGVKL